MLDIIGKRFRFFLISGVIILIGIISLAIFGLPAGIEFSSGSMLAVSFEEKVEHAPFQQEIDNLGYTKAIIQRTGEGDFLIRTQELTDAEKEDYKEALGKEEDKEGKNLTGSSLEDKYLQISFLFSDNRQGLEAYVFS